MNFKKRVNGSWTDTPHYIHNTSTDTITTLPADLYPNDTTATVDISGNMEQSGAPTPSNPIQPSETGERTAQLFEDKIANCSIDANGNLIGNPAFAMYIAKVEQGVTYTASARITGGFYETKPIIGSVSYNGQRVAFAEPTVTAPITGYMTFRVNFGSDEPMLNTGSTALPYEPYGYKIPISSAGQTTPVYLGEVETTRRVKKLVLDGTENLNEDTSNYYILINVSGRGEGIPNSTALSTHTESGVVVNNNGTALFFKKSVFVHSSLADFKSYLQQQYAAGTPVTIWYVLASETTGIVNEPLRKIGDYADTVSGITIPTITGADSFDMLTTLKPSEVSLSYTGWHDASVKEWDGSQWG